jgi:cell wall-associated NlpC family hydrolase
LAELGNDEFSSRRERKLAEKKTLSKSARSFATSARERGTALVSAAQEVATAAPVVRAARAARSENNGRNWARAGVMAVALGLMATFSIPAYAIDSSDHVDVEAYKAQLAAEAQLLEISGESNASASRDGYTTAAAVTVAAATRSASSSRVSVDVSGIASNSALLNASLNLIGMPGDCTAFVEQSLRNLGYSVPDLGPMQFGGYGTVFSDPSQVQPGDIMMRGNHVAIYAGNGLATQGGIGGTSVLTSISGDPHQYSLFVRVG